MRKSSTQRTRLTRCAATLALLVLLLTGAPLRAAESDAGAGVEHVARMGFDLLILRPLNLVTTAVSLVGAALSYPVALAFGGEDHVVEYLVERPLTRTFRRPLGEL